MARGKNQLFKNILKKDVLVLSRKVLCDVGLLWSLCASLKNNRNRWFAFSAFIAGTVGNIIIWKVYQKYQKLGPYRVIRRKEDTLTRMIVEPEQMENLTVRTLNLNPLIDQSFYDQIENVNIYAEESLEQFQQIFDGLESESLDMEGQQTSSEKNIKVKTFSDFLQSGNFLPMEESTSDEKIIAVGRFLKSIASIYKSNEQQGNEEKIEQNTPKKKSSTCLPKEQHENKDKIKQIAKFLKNSSDIFEWNVRYDICSACKVLKQKSLNKTKNPEDYELKVIKSFYGLLQINLEQYTEEFNFKYMTNQYNEKIDEYFKNRIFEMMMSFRICFRSLTLSPGWLNEKEFFAIGHKSDIELPNDLTFETGIQIYSLIKDLLGMLEERVHESVAKFISSVRTIKAVVKHGSEAELNEWVKKHYNGENRLS